MGAKLKFNGKNKKRLCLFIFDFFPVMHYLPYVGFVPLGDLLDIIGEYLKIQCLPIKVLGLMSIHFL